VNGSRRSTESLTIIKTESGSKGSTETSTLNRTGSNFRGYKEPFNLKVTLDMLLSMIFIIIDSSLEHLMSLMLYFVKVFVDYKIGICCFFAKHTVGSESE
jgi:hypothetical protein